MDPLGVGVIGSGFMGRTWAQVATLCEGTELRAIAGGRRAPGLGADFGVDVEDSVAALIARDDVDIIVVTSPPNAHVGQVLAAAENGKHVLVEKPLARDSAECVAMIEACDRAGTQLAVVSQHRYRDSPLAAKRLIDDGAIGSVRMVRVSGLDAWWDMTETQDEWKLDHEQIRVFADWGAHGCDVLRWFVGSPAVLAYAQYHTYADQPPPGQSILATYRFANDVMASVWMTYEVPEPRLGSALQFLITGSEGMIDVDAYGAVRLARDGVWSTVFEQVPFDSLDTGSAGRLEAYRRELDDVVQAVRTGVPAPVSGREGLLTQRMLDAVESCAQTGLAVDLTKVI